jgi:hydroxylamine reductase
MFCFQCQETAKNVACTVKGVCGKDEDTSNLMDVLVYGLKGVSILARRKKAAGDSVTPEGRLIMKSLFATITNANFDRERIIELIFETLDVKQKLLDRYGDRRGDASGGGGAAADDLPRAATWSAESTAELYAMVSEAAVTAEQDEDVRSVKEFMIYGLKGLSAYGHHAWVLGFEDEGLYARLVDLLATTTEEHDIHTLLEQLVETGRACADTMALLDRANTETYGNPEISEVNLGVRNRPGILISGHDLKDMEELLRQTEGTGVDVYTHSEMLPANYYPAFKKYEHFVGNYGNAWWKQNTEFAAFNGPILMTTNCITPVRDSYRDRIFTTGMAGYPGVPHIPEREDGGEKDFSEIIELAKRCDPPAELETGTITGGFAHAQLTALADTVVDAVQKGAIRKFVVMAGCDGRMKSREYYSEVAKQLPEDTVILTAGCAKYRYNKLDLGEIGGIPRVLDAGQCNDSYSLAVIAMKLQEILGAEDINDLPIDFDVAWYEQKAVCVLLALLALGFKGVRIGPTLPAFLSQRVAEKIISAFDLKGITDVESDVAAIAGS